MNRLGRKILLAEEHPYSPSHTPEGGSYMAHTIERAWRPGRALVLAAGLLLAGGVLLQARPAQPPAKPADKTKTTPSKDKAAGPRARAIHLPADVGNDVREMVGVINSKLEEAWKENK